MILLIDTSTGEGVVAIEKEGKAIAVEYHSNSKEYSSAINGMITRCLEKAHVSIHDINAVSVCGGPGSYTGLRIGMATAKGLCYALDIPLIVCSRMQLISLSHTTGRVPVIVLLKAREGEYFMATYRGNEEIEKPKLVMEEEVRELMKDNINSVIMGDIPNFQTVLTEKQLSNSNNLNIEIERWISYSEEKLLSGDISDLRNAEPLYIKDVYFHK